MKKLLVAVLTLSLVLVGCGQHQSNNSDKKDDSSQAYKEDERNKMIKGQIEYGFENSNYKGYDHYKKIMSKKMQNESKNQNQSATNKNIKKEVRDLKLYQDVDNDDQLLYSVRVSTTNKKNNKSLYQEHYGKITLTTENNEDKIENIEELTQKELVSMTQ